MANNRMYLIHRETGFAVYLGKRMGEGWYDAPEDLGKRLNSLFDVVGASDDFMLAFEAAPYEVVSTRDSGRGGVLLVNSPR